MRNGVHFHTGLLRTELTQKAWVEMLPAAKSKTARPGVLSVRPQGAPTPPERAQSAGSAERSLVSVQWIHRNDVNKILTFDEKVACPNIATETVHPHSEFSH